MTLDSRSCRRRGRERAPRQHTRRSGGPHARAATHLELRRAERSGGGAHYRLDPSLEVAVLLVAAEVLGVDQLPVLREVLRRAPRRGVSAAPQGAHAAACFRGAAQGRTASVRGSRSSRFLLASPKAARACSRSAASCRRCWRSFSASGSASTSSAAEAALLAPALGFLSPAAFFAAAFCGRGGRARRRESGGRGRSAGCAAGGKVGLVAKRRRDVPASLPPPPRAGSRARPSPRKEPRTHRRLRGAATALSHSLAMPLPDRQTAGAAGRCAARVGAPHDRSSAMLCGAANAAWRLRGKHFPAGPKEGANERRAERRDGDDAHQRLVRRVASVLAAAAAAAGGNARRFGRSRHRTKKAALRARVPLPQRLGAPAECAACRLHHAPAAWQTLSSPACPSRVTDTRADGAACAAQRAARAA